MSKGGMVTLWHYLYCVNHYAAIVRTTRPRYVLIGEDLEPMLPKLP